MANKKISELPSIGSGTIDSDDLFVVVVDGVTSNATIGKVKSGLDLHTYAERIDVMTKYGLVADGLTDNAVALMQMNSDLKGLGKPFYYLDFSTPGEIRYSDNRWLDGILRFCITAYGVTFRCSSSSAYDFLRQPFASGDMFYNYPTVSAPGTVSTGYLFNSVVPGATTVTTTVAANAGNFAAGNRVFIYGFDQQHNGYPPNARYFEWNEVVSANAGTGVVTLKYPIKDAYSSSWQDTANYVDTQPFGKPRIINLDRGISNYVLPYHAEWRGCTMGIGTVGPLAGAFGFTADTLILRDVVTENDIWPSQNRIAEYYRCKFASSDLDKLCDNVYFEDCRFETTLFAGTGFHKVTYKGCVMQAEAAILSKSITMENCTIRGNTNLIPLRLHPQAVPCDKIELKDLKFVVGPSASYDACIDLGGLNTFTVDGISTTDILLTDDSTAQNVVNAIGKGTWMQKQDGTKGGYVKDITYNGSNQYVISGTWVAPVTSETWVYRVVKDVVDHGGHVISDPLTPLLAANTMLWANNLQLGGGIKTARWKGNILRWFEGTGDCIMDLNGYIIDIVVAVTKPYTGGVSNPKLYLDTAHPTFTPAIDINLSAVGVRFVSPYAVSGAQTADALSFANTVGYKKQVNLILGGGGSIISGLTVNQLPEVEVTIRWMPGSTG